MESKINSRNKANDILRSILAGVGIMIGVFLFSASSIGFLSLVLAVLFSCGEFCLSVIILFSPILGGLIGLFAGTVGGLRKYKSLQSENITNSSNDESIENISKDDFSKLNYRQRFVLTEYGFLLSPENAEVVGEMLGNFQDKDVLSFCRANGKKVSVEK